MENQVYYFSGTGNCLKVAKDIAATLNDCSLTAITQDLLNKPLNIKCKKCVIIYPSYAYGPPSIILKFFESANFEIEYLALGITYGSHYGATLSKLKRPIKKAGIKNVFYFAIKSVENYIPIFGSQKDQTVQKRLLNQSEKTKDYITQILNGDTNNIKTFKPLSLPISLLFRGAKRFLCKFYRVSKKCNGCGVCAKVCSAKAISLKQKNHRPEFKGSRCQQCQACLNFCPQKAITFFRLTKKAKRYHHPDINLGEFTAMIEKNKLNT